MVLLVMVDQSNIGVADERRGPGGAAARVSWSCWREGAAILLVSSHRAGTSTESVICMSLISLEKARFFHLIGWC